MNDLVFADNQDFSLKIDKLWFSIDCRLLKPNT